MWPDSCIQGEGLAGGTSWLGERCSRKLWGIAQCLIQTSKGGHFHCPNTTILVFLCPSSDAWRLKAEVAVADCESHVCRDQWGYWLHCGPGAEQFLMCLCCKHVWMPWPFTHDFFLCPWIYCNKSHIHPRTLGLFERDLFWKTAPFLFPFKTHLFFLGHNFPWTSSALLLHPKISWPAMREERTLDQWPGNPSVSPTTNHVTLRKHVPSWGLRVLTHQRSALL